MLYVARSCYIDHESDERDSRMQNACVWWFYIRMCSIPSSQDQLRACKCALMSGNMFLPLGVSAVSVQFITGFRCRTKTVSSVFSEELQRGWFLRHMKHKVFLCVIYIERKVSHFLLYLWWIYQLLSLNVADTSSFCTIWAFKLCL